MTWRPSIEELRRNAPDFDAPDSGPPSFDVPGADPPVFDAHLDEPDLEVPPLSASPPTVLALTVDEAIVADGDDIVLRWEVADADQVTIDGIGELPAVGSARILAETSRTFVLRASNSVGEAVRRFPDVRILVMPEIGLMRVVLPEVRVQQAARGWVRQPGASVAALRRMAPGRLEGLPGAPDPALSQGPTWTDSRQSPA